MEQEKQQKFRSELVELYEKKAFESFANYNYYGVKLQNLEQEIQRLTNRKEEMQKKLAEFEGKKDRTPAEKEAIKLYRKDVKDYTDRIESVQVLAKKQYETATQWQTQAMTFLEMIENFKVFKLKTPEEIQAEKEKAAKPDGSLKEPEVK